MFILVILHTIQGLTLSITRIKSETLIIAVLKSNMLAFFYLYLIIRLMVCALRVFQTFEECIVKSHPQCTQNITSQLTYFLDTKQWCGKMWAIYMYMMYACIGWWFAFYISKALWYTMSYIITVVQESCDTSVINACEALIPAWRAQWALMVDSSQLDWYYGMHHTISKFILFSINVAILHITIQLQLLFG